MGWLFALGLERACCGVGCPLPHGVWAGAALVFLAQNSKEAKNSKLSETAFQVIKVEGWNKFYVTVSWPDLFITFQFCRKWRGASVFSPGPHQE